MKKKSVMVVDDEKMVIMALTQILSPEYSIYAVKNGHDALKIAEKFLPDLILLDIIMPEITGFEVLEILKNADTVKNIPVILISGIDEQSERDKGQALGAVDFITKPFTRETILERTKKYLEQ